MQSDDYMKRLATAAEETMKSVNEDDVLREELAKRLNEAQAAGRSAEIEVERQARISRATRSALQELERQAEAKSQFGPVLQKKVVAHGEG